MFTKLFLAIKHFPQWMRDVLIEDKILYYGVWSLIGTVVLSIMHFFSFRNDTIYLILMFAIPFVELFAQIGRIIQFKVKKTIQSRFQQTSENFPILFIIVMMAVNFPMIIYTHHGFGSEIYDEYFVMMIFEIVLILLYIILSKLKGKIRLGILMLSYLLGLSFLAITYILAITI